jgi:tetratricopeptide (TPR) repeat protein
MYYRRFSFFVLLLLSVSFLARAEESLPELVRRVKPSVVSIATYNSNNEPLMSGSGFFVRSGQVVTNLHVIEGADHAEIRILDGKGKTLKVNGILKSDEEGDLALLSVVDPSDKVRTVQIAKSTPDEGEKIFVIGNPLRLEGSISDGIVAAVREVPALGTVVQITAPISNGSSGSPVFNMNGQVIGVVTIKVTNGQNINMALGVSRLNALVPGSLVALNKRAERVKMDVKDETMSEGWYKSGISSLWLGNYDRALGYFRSAIEHDPARVEAWIEVGFCMVKQGKNDDAIKALQRAIQLKPDSAEAWNKLGDAYYYATRYPEAISAYQQAIKIEPNMADAHYNLGVTYSEMGDRDAAFVQSKLLERIDPDLYKKLLSELR